ncbi:MAG TPA: hypothetical protein DDX47_02255 [Candidatus Jacksonbacteria bacterium]|nr:hypothetical protein [Candidatus Jacksonbacteria bacterium]HCR15403.1 hypothetical protein [Candidatus Jacksonbacteria bacterium]
MENREFKPSNEPKSVEAAVRCFLDGDTNVAIAFLRANRDEITEFCLQVRDSYTESDRATPFAMLARLIEKLL